MSTTNAGTGVALPPPPVAAPFWTPVLPEHDQDTALGAFDQLDLIWAPRPGGFAGNRGPEGVQAEEYVISYADSQIDLPVNLVARLAPGVSYANDSFTDALDWTDPELMSLPPAQSGHSPTYMRSSDDLTLLEREMQMYQRWFIGAP